MNRLIWIFFVLSPVILFGQAVHISTSRDTICSGTPATFTSIISSISNPHFKWRINSTHAGTDNPVFTSSLLTNSDTVSCIVTNLTGDTVFAISNYLVMTVDSMPDAGEIEGLDIVCQYSSITLTDIVTGGVWSAENTNATVSGGIVTGMRVISGFDYLVWPSYDTIFYTVTNSCGSSKATKLIEIHPLPWASFFLGTPVDPIYELCVGQDVMIDGGAGYTHLLYSKYGHAVPDFFNNNVHGVSAGSETLVAVDTNYCGVDTFRINIKVNTVPEIFPILLPSNEICAGEPVTLSDSSKGVLNWFSTKNGKIVGWTGLLTGLLPGLDTITLRSSNQCGATYADTVITILPPGLITTSDSLCAGATIQLYDLYSGGTWSSVNNAKASVDQEGHLFSTSADTITIRYSLGGCTVSKTVSLHALPAPISGYSALCTNGSTILAEATRPGKWSSSDETVAIVDTTGHVYSINAGTANIIFTDKYGCISNIEVTVNPLPPAIIGISDVCVEHGMYLSDNASGGKWTNRDSTIVRIDSLSGYVTGIGIGRDLITYTLPTGCYTEAYIKSDYCPQDLDIYPNPVNSILTFQSDTIIYNEFRLINITGQVVIHQPIKESFTKIDVHLLPYGIYYLEFLGPKNKYVKKIKKE